MKRWPLLAVLIAVAIILSKVVFEDLLAIPWVESVERLLADPGPGTAVAIVGLLTIDLLLPVPSSLVMVLSGTVFGVAAGGILALVGSLAGNLLGFELTRRFGRNAARRLVGDVQLDQMRVVFERHGALAILLSRPLPVMMETLSLVAGLSEMRRRTFLWASLAGTIPVALLYALAGAWSMQTGNLLPGLVILISVAAGGWRLLRPRLLAPGDRSPASDP